MSKIVLGIDEVGRGCWAGPLVVGAVCLEESIIGLTDSKLLSKSQRQFFSDQISQKAEYAKTGWVWPDEIDELGLTNSIKLGIRRAVDDVFEYDELIIDGNYNFIPDNPRASHLIKADLKIPCVSAASILAKVARDLYMTDQHKNYPQYNFQTNVGYGTKFHYQAIIDHGITPLHRKSFKPIRIMAG